MGTWALPNTLEKAKKLQIILSKPLMTKDATDKLYHLIGDDDLFDQIISLKKEIGNQYDVRSITIKYLRSFLENSYNWESNSLRICQKICKNED